MYSSFISMVVVVDKSDNEAAIGNFLAASSIHLSKLFTDYEVIIVENGSRFDFGKLKLTESVRRNCYSVTLANEVLYDLAALAGLERANGDYTILFDALLVEHLDLLYSMFAQAQAGHDIVLLSDRRPLRGLSLSSWAFFSVMKKAHPGKIDARDRKEVLLSRRALNWVLRYRNRNAYLGEIITSSGYKLARVKVEIRKQRHRRAADRQRLAWAVLARMSQVPLRIASTTMFLLFFALAAFIANALSVRLLGVNLIGQQDFAEPGWTYLVILTSVGFLLTNITLYAILRILLIISEDVRREPNYIVEAFQRF